MMDAKSKEPVEDEIFQRLPPAFKLLVEFARERGIIGNERPGDRSGKVQARGEKKVKESAGSAGA